LPLLPTHQTIIIVQGQDKSKVQEEGDKKIQEEGMIHQSLVTLVDIYQISITIMEIKDEEEGRGVVITLV